MSRVSHGLAFMSRHVPTEGFSDLDQGRVGETEVPHSDQWFDSVAKGPGTYRPDKFNMKNVLKERNKGGYPTITVEEIYQAHEYLSTDNKGGGLHNAVYEAGRYVYESPGGWVNANTNNRVIALRRCDVKPAMYAFNVDFRLSAVPDNSYSVKVLITPDYGIEDALETITRAMQNKYERNGAIRISWQYDPKTFHAMIIVTGSNLSFISTTDKGLWKLLNVPQAQQTGLIENPKAVYDFYDVWNRPDLFIHASFVNNTAGGLLSRGDEFYTSPSKMYQVEYPTSTFFFEVSFDGFHRVQLPYENFIVELSFIIDVNDYHD